MLVTSPRFFYFAVIGDSHIIDDDYVGPESTPLDSESIFSTRRRLARACDLLNVTQPAPELVFHVGDYIHDYPSSDWAFYFQRETRLDHAKAITDALRMPFYLNFGNHDYDLALGRAFTHALFWEKFGVEPFYAVTYQGWKFLQLNNFLGDTWDRRSANFNVQLGSFGLEQLDWLEAELAQGYPTFLFVHFPLPALQVSEHLDRGLLPLLTAHKETVQHVFSGHLHRWMEFSSRSGLPNLVIGSTRYDPHARVLVEVDRTTQRYRFLNEAEWGWFTHYTVGHKQPITFSDADATRVQGWR